MNASPYHSKVRVTLKFADTQFAAGGMVAGKMELECKAEKGLGISVIMVELYAIEGTIPFSSHPAYEFVRIKLEAYIARGCSKHARSLLMLPCSPRIHFYYLPPSGRSKFFRHRGQDLCEPHNDVRRLLRPWKIVATPPLYRKSPRLDLMKT